MNPNPDNLVLGIEFKISIEKRHLEVVEPSLIAPKNALQCTSREEIDQDSKAFYEAIDRRSLFVSAINEIQKYEWGTISTDTTYQINIPGFDVSYYYVDITSLQTHILKYYVVCHFVSDIATTLGKPAAIGADGVTQLLPDGQPSRFNLKRTYRRLTGFREWATPLGRWTTPFRQWAGLRYAAFPIKNVAWYGVLTLAGCAMIILTLESPRLLPSHSAPTPGTTSRAAPPAFGDVQTGTPAGTTVAAPLALPPVPPAPLPTILPASTAPPPAVAAKPVAVQPAKPVAAPAKPPTPVATGQPAPHPAEDAAPAVLPRTKPTESPGAAPAHEDGQALRLQQALMTLGYFDGPLNGLMGPKTRKAMADFARVVPPAALQRYGNNSLALVEAALRGEFALVTNPPRPPK
jgi:hypothetical protein